MPTTNRLTAFAMTLKTSAAALALLALAPVANAQPKVQPPPDKAALAKEVANLLQACSYDGSPLTIDPAVFSLRNVEDGRAMVAHIMRFTGLPPNFDVVEGKVPNAAAVIMLDENKMPKRVIAYNPDFMKQVREATQRNDWSAISIMAHEIGHHLSGHTLMRGGSQPPIELEADKFSGFVLHKMGASVADARKAIETLVGPDDGPTHPGRAKRVSAIGQGWVLACEQNGRTDCSQGQPRNITLASAPPPAQTAAPKPAATSAPTVTTAQPASPPVAAPKTAHLPDASAQPAAEPRTAPTGPAVLPTLSPDAIPSKFDRFVYDETGLLDKAFTTKIEQQMFDHARDTGTEIVTLIVKDLKGMEPNAYAGAMLRQLRVGKMDVGNGAVLVYAPEQKQFGMALGSGIVSRVRGHTDRYVESAKGFFEDYYDYCKEKGQCSSMQTELFFDSADHIRRDTRGSDWQIRYPNFASLHEKVLQESKMSIPDITKSEVRGRLSRIRGTVEKINAPAEKQINASVVESGYVPVTLKGEDGVRMVMYVLPSTMTNQPSQLEEGKTYSFVGRSQFLTHNLKDLQGFEALSYVLTQ